MKSPRKLTPKLIEIDGCRIPDATVMQRRVEDRDSVNEGQDPDALPKTRVPCHEESLARRQPMCVTVDDETGARRHTTVFAHADVKLAIFGGPDVAAGCRCVRQRGGDGRR